eukprot:187555-Lingulodinium_polyedra.AAC.1
MTGHTRRTTGHGPRASAAVGEAAFRPDPLWAPPGLALPRRRPGSRWLAWPTALTSTLPGCRPARPLAR